VLLQHQTRSWFLFDDPVDQYAFVLLNEIWSLIANPSVFVFFPRSPCSAHSPPSTFMSQWSINWRTAGFTAAAGAAVIGGALWPLRRILGRALHSAPTRQPSPATPTPPVAGTAASVGDAAAAAAAVIPPASVVAKLASPAAPVKRVVTEEEITALLSDAQKLKEEGVAAFKADDHTLALEVWSKVWKRKPFCAFCF
jgi:hypothetical protein